MAGFFQQFLKGAGDGFVGSPFLRDYEHASKIFRTGAYGNSPKFKWLFHVYFDINKYQISGTNVDQIFPSTTNYGLLVKSIDLPKYSITLQEMNQYNRKRYVQTKINYDPIRISFHDDNNNQIRQLWFNYFSYYYNDPNQPVAPDSRPGDAATKLNPRNIYQDNVSSNQNWGYIGEIPQYSLDGMTYEKTKAPFFKSIRIYGFNQHNWALYEVINPMIESFNHDNYNYYETRGIMEHQMTIRYENVKYYDGALNGQDPSSIVAGFGNSNQYDTTLSPINLPGSNRTIEGPGGLLDAAEGFSKDLANGNYLGALQTAMRTKRTFKNSGQILQAAKSELIAGVIGETPGLVRGAFNFPAAGATNGTGQQNTNKTNALNTNPPPVETRNIPPGRP